MKNTEHTDSLVFRHREGNKSRGLFPLFCNMVGF